jgi:hypothetical protein
MVNPQKTNRSGSVASAEPAVWKSWREEIRSFIEQTVQEIHRIVADLQTKPRASAAPPPTELRPADAPGKRPEESRPRTQPTNRPSRVEADAASQAARAEAVDPIDASRTRLENLKRRLSEQLRTQQTSTTDADERPREESHA